MSIYLHVRLHKLKILYLSPRGSEVVFELYSNTAHGSSSPTASGQRSVFWPWALSQSTAKTPISFAKDPQHTDAEEQGQEQVESPEAASDNIPLVDNSDATGVHLLNKYLVRILWGGQPMLTSTPLGVLDMIPLPEFLDCEFPLLAHRGDLLAN